MTALLIHNRASVKTVQLALGHNTPMIMLNTYAHEWPDALDRTRTLVDEARGRPGRGHSSAGLTCTRSAPGSLPCRSAAGRGFAIRYRPAFRS